MVKKLNLFRSGTINYRDSALRACFSILLYFIVIHSLLSIWDYHHPDVFMSADRASTRLISIEKLLSAANSSNGSISQIISKQGIIGDYLFHAVLFAIGGKALVIAIQIALTCISISFIFWLTLVLTNRQDVSVFSMLIYIHLPYTLIYPHMLCTEAIFSPLIILSFVTIAIFKLTNDNVWMLCISAFFIGISALIRPIALLLPLVIIAGGLFFGQLNYKSSFAYLIIAFLPMVSWMTAMQVISGDFTMGRSGHDLNHNLYGRVDYISRTVPKKEAEEIRKTILEASNNPNELTLTRYLFFVAKYPVASAKHYLNDLAAFTAKSGIESIIFDYLQLESEFRKNLRNRSNSWRRIMDKNGIFYVIFDILKKKPFIILASLFGTIYLLALWSFYVYGIWTVYNGRDKQSPFINYLHTLLVLLPPYVFATSTLCMNIQSRHRAPVEFCIAILSAIGYFGLIDHLNREKESLPSG